MTENKLEEHKITKEDAELIIGEIITNVSVLGRNSNELHDLMEIHTLLQAGKYTPEDAVAKAREIESSKQDH